MPADSFLVTWIEPANEEAGVSPETQIKITFRTFMDESTFTQENIRIVSSEEESVPWRYIDYINSNKMLIIEPDGLKSETEYTIILAGTSKGIKSLATNYYLPADKHYVFSTGAGSVPDENEEAPVEPAPGTPESPKPSQPGPPIEDIFSFGIKETYPVDGAVHITPEKVIALFDSELDADTINEDSVYIIRAKGKDRIGPLDLMTVYSPEKKVQDAVVTVEGNTLVIDAQLADNAEYTVIVRSTVKSKSGNALGQTVSWSFMTKFPYLYGDAELIRNDLSIFMNGIPDRILYKMMRDNSEFAYEVATRSGTMPATNAEGAPMHVHQYVRYKTAYDLLINGQIRESSSSGNNIRLGDLSVDKSGESSDMTAVSRDFKNQIKVWEDALRGYNDRGYAMTRSVVRGENVVTYPDFLTRSEYRELGE